MYSVTKKTGWELFNQRNRPTLAISFALHETGAVRSGFYTPVLDGETETQ